MQGYVGGSRGSCIVSSAADVLWMSVVRGMRGLGGVFEMCMCLARAVWVEMEGDWMSRILGPGSGGVVLCMCEL